MPSVRVQFQPYKQQIGAIQSRKYTPDSIKPEVISYDADHGVLNIRIGSETFYLPTDRGTARNLYARKDVLRLGHGGTLL
jgi:hypothetical protein